MANSEIIGAGQDGASCAEEHEKYGSSVCKELLRYTNYEN